MNANHMFLSMLLLLSLISCKHEMIGTPLLYAEKTNVDNEPLWVSEVKYQDSSTGIFLGSPSLLRLANGDILASHDYNGPTSNTTAVYRSQDDGLTWNHITDITGLFWANLFEHQGTLYFLGTNAGTGVVARTIVICHSTDQGATWSTPVTLFDEDIPGQPVRYHGAPTPVVSYNGRLYRGFEALDTQYNWTRGYRAFVISAAEGSNLMMPSSWKMSTKARYNEGWDPPGSAETTGWIEGNAVISPAGKLVNVIRVNSVPFVDKAAILRVSDNGDSIAFTPDDFIDFPGGLHKFVIRKDEITGVYLTMVNNNTNTAYPQQRNILSLYGSINLRQWYYLETLMEDDQGLPFNVSVAKTGFQYADWQFDGNDLIYLVRTSYDGAYNYHNANRITFGKVEDFRSLLAVPMDSTLATPLEKIPEMGAGNVGYVRFDYAGHSVVYTTVRAKDGKVWLRQNLGANWITRSSQEIESFGDLFQWGRHVDGHQNRSSSLFDSPATNNPLGAEIAGNPFFYGGSGAVWWDQGIPTDTWDGMSTAQITANRGYDPCRIVGANWRLPTSAEWQLLATEEAIINTESAFTSSLRLSRAGYRLGTNGTLYYTNGRYWTDEAHASVTGAAVAFHFTDTGVNTAITLARSGGLSIRCIRDED